MKDKRLFLSVEDRVLRELLSEQLHQVKGAVLVDSEQGGVDVLLTDQPGDRHDEEKLSVIRLGERGGISLPCRLGDVLDRVSYALSGRGRYATGVGEGPLYFSGFEFLPDENIISDQSSGRQVRLTDKEKRLLLSLYVAENHRMDRKSLLHTVWGYADNVETHTLETHLYRLRQKIEDVADRDLILAEDGSYLLLV